MKYLLSFLSASLLATALPALAQTTPRAFFEQSTPSGAGNALNIYRVPVITSAGGVVYKDVQIQFNVSAAGDLSLKSGFPIITASPVLLTGNFIPGRYKIDGTYYQLSGPGVGPAGRTTWSLGRESNDSCLTSAGWTSGPIAGHPSQARLTAAKITYAGHSYGVLGEVRCYGRGIPTSFQANDLIGVAATANGFTIFNYTPGIYSGSGDQPSPISSASFQRCLNAAC